MKKSLKSLALALALSLMTSVVPAFAQTELPAYESEIMTTADLDAFFALDKINTSWGDAQLSKAVGKLYTNLKASGNADIVTGIDYRAVESYDEASEKSYASYFADFELSTKEDVAIILAGNYGTFGTIPVGIANIEAGKSVRVMDTAAELFGLPGLKFTYEDIVWHVGEFACTAIPLTPEVMEAFYPIMTELSTDFANAYPEYSDAAMAEMLNYLQENATIVGSDRALPVVEGTPGLTLGLNLYETEMDENGDPVETGKVYEITENIFVPYEATVIENPTFIADKENYKHGGEVVADLYQALVAADNADIVYAMNFKAVETYDEANAAPYGKYIADFELASSVDASVLLVGNYDAWKDKTVGTVPIGIINLTAGQPTRILKTASDNVAVAATWTFNYKEICELVKEFDCAAIPVSKEFLEAYYAVKCEDADYLAANPQYTKAVENALLADLLEIANPLNAASFKVANKDLELSLNLKLYENDPSSKYAETGKSWIVGNTNAFTYVAPEIEAVAEVNGVGYETLAEAIAAADGATVIMLADVEVAEEMLIAAGKTVTLDLNGKTITATDTKTNDNFSLFINKGNFTVTDSAEGGKILLTAETNRYWNKYSSVISNQAGTLTIEAGHLEHLGKTDMAYVIDNNSTLGKTVATINGGTLVTPYRAIRLFQNNKTEDNIVTVNDGTINARAGIWMQQTSKTSVASGTLNITGGEIACTANAVVVDICGAATSDVNISGGTFSNTSETANLLLIWPLVDMNSVTTASATMNITGGDFNCAGEGKLIGILDGADANGDVVISGGTYSEEVSGYCADGYECAANGDGTYGIQVAQLKVAEVNGETYETIAAAIAAANDGDVITIIGAASDETLTVEKSVTITSDENNKQTLNNVHITASGTAVELTVTNLKFTGSSYINANNASALTVIGCEANVDPKKVTGRAAFIVPGTSELNNQPLLLKVKDNIILSAQSGTDYYSAAIFGWRYLADGTEISNNVMGSENERYTFVAVKTMNAMDGARFTFENNTIYGTNVPYVFVAFDLYQNNSRANTYTVLSKNNMIDVDTSGNNMYVVFYLEGNTGFNNNSNIILQDNGTTINGRAITMTDIEASDLSSDYSKYYGVNVVTDAEGKLIAGCFSTDVSAYCAEGFKTEKNEAGDYVVVEEEKEEEKDMMQKMLVIYNMKPTETAYPIHVYSGIDSLNYQEVGYKIKVTNMQTEVTQPASMATKVVYTSMKVTNANGDQTIYQATEMGDDCNYMFGLEMTFNKQNWTNQNTKIEVTPYAKNFDKSEILGKTITLTDEIIKKQNPNSALFREEK